MTNEDDVAQGGNRDGTSNKNRIGRNRGALTRMCSNIPIQGVVGAGNFRSEERQGDSS